MSQIARYGVKEASSAQDDIDIRVEELKLLGYTTVPSELGESELDQLSASFDRGSETYRESAGSRGVDLQWLSESDTVRVLPLVAPAFWNVAFNAPVHELLKRTLGEYYILNQVNGLTNRAKTHYSQAAYHRDLPYQHFVSSRPIAINALFAMDDFTIENGATRVIPASHKMELFPADQTVRNLEKQIEVPRGTFIVLDCMVFHAGSPNRSARDRRAVNHVFTIPMLRQQLHLPSVVGSEGDFTEWQRKVLGFGLDEYRSIDEWFDARSNKS